VVGEDAKHGQDIISNFKVEISKFGVNFSCRHFKIYNLTFEIVSAYVSLRFNNSFARGKAISATRLEPIGCGEDANHGQDYFKLQI
jgi:hypothetical protein